MSGSINKVIICGNLGRDPEIRHTPDGKRIATLSVATSESWKDKVTGERKDKTEWHRTVIFNDKLTDIAEKYLRKGSKVFVEGQLQTRKWTNNEGSEQYTTEIVLSQFKGELTLMDNRPADSIAATSFASPPGSAHDTSPTFASPSSQADRSHTYPYNQFNTSQSPSPSSLTSSTSTFAAPSPAVPRPSASILDDDVPF